MVAVEGPDSIPDLDLAGTDELRVLVTDCGVPCAIVDLPSLGPGSHGAIARAALSPHLEAHRARRRLRAGLRGRLGAPEVRHSRPTSSVVICTHRRRALLAELLDSTDRLDPAPDEVIVVDNDPGDEDCRTEVERAGARYVREDRRGLNNARSTGLRVARSEVVAFTDDDCILPPGWLAPLPERFSDPMVGAVTGPAFPRELDTAEQLRREQVAPYLQGLTARTVDWTTMPVVKTGIVGFGANMILRRSALADIGEPFPPELDAGTRTRSGGDLYALYRILAAGHRVSYDPAAFVLHRHGRNGDAAERTVEGWATGLTAFLARALILDRELGALPYSTLSLRAFCHALLDAAQGTGDATLARMRWVHLRAAIGGPAAWLLALREAARERPDLERAGGEPARAAEPARPPDKPPRRRRRTGPASPPVSVILATKPGGDLVMPRLDELAARQTIDAEWETIVVSPDEPFADPERGDRGSVTEVAEGVPVRWVRGEGSWSERVNAGAAAARADVLLFVADELTWEPRLLAAHLRRHREAGAEVAVLGYSPVRPRGRGLAALVARLRSEDDFRLTGEAARRTFSEVDASNLSISRGALERVGRFDPGLDPTRAGWEWGLRALRAGVEVAYEPEAAAGRERSITTHSYVEDGRAEGRADAVLLARRPELGPDLPRPPAARTVTGRAVQAAAISALRPRGARRGAFAVLALLEAARLRRAWLMLATAARRGAYAEGFGSGPTGAVRRSRSGESVEVVELDSARPVNPPVGAAPSLVELRLRGRRVAGTTPRGGHWHHAALEDALAEADPAGRAATALAARGGAGRPPNLTGMAVVFGPDRRPNDARHGSEFEAAGATVAIARRVTGGPRDRRAGSDHWSEIDRVLREALSDVVGIPLPGVSPKPLWLAEALAGLEDGPLAAVIGAGVEQGQPSGPLELLSPKRRWLPYEHGVRPPQYIVVRRAVYEELGGFDPTAAVAGPLGPPLDLVERCLEAGLVVGYRETPGLTPAGDRAVAPNRGRWQRAQASGALLARRAVAIGGVRGAAWFATRGLLPRVRGLAATITSRDRSLIKWTAGSVGFLVGCGRAATSGELKRDR